MQAALAGVAVSGDVRVDREAGFVTGNIEGDDAAAAELLDKLCRLHALLFGEMAQRAKDQARFEARFADEVFGRTVDDADDLLGSQPLFEMEQRSKAEFGVDDAVVDELAEDVFGDEAQRHLALHQPESLVRPGEKFSKVGAARGRDVVGLVFFMRDGWRER